MVVSIHPLLGANDKVSLVFHASLIVKSINNHHTYNKTDILLITPISFSSSAYNGNNNNLPSPTH